MPGWAALPAAIAGGALITAVFGYLLGRLAAHRQRPRRRAAGEPRRTTSSSPACSASSPPAGSRWCCRARTSARARPRSSSRATGTSPVGGAAHDRPARRFALVGFPLDDVWHRLFGQDVTLWGPTHLMMLGGAGMTLIAILVLLAEGRARPRARRAPASAHGRSAFSERVAQTRPPGPVRRCACGGLLIGLSIFQGEFDFGVPQFRLLFQPLLIALAAGCRARRRARPGRPRRRARRRRPSTSSSAACSTLIVGPVLGESTPHFPLYIAEALIVEAVALARRARSAAAASARRRRRAIGTVGVARRVGLVARVDADSSGPAHIAARGVAALAPGRRSPAACSAPSSPARSGSARIAAAPRRLRRGAAGLARDRRRRSSTCCPPVPDGARAAVALTDVDGAARARGRRDRALRPAVARRRRRLVHARSPGRAAKLVAVEPLERVGDGVYRTTEPMPVGGIVEDGRSASIAARMIASVPVFMPEDAAIPAAEIPAPPRFDARLHRRPATILQRERKDDVPGWLYGMAGLVVLGTTAGLLFTLGWALARIARIGSGRGSPPAPKVESRPVAPAVPAAG